MNPHLVQLVMGVGRIGPNGVQPLGTAFTVSHNRAATAAHVTEQNDNDLVVIMPRVTSLMDYQDAASTQASFLKVKIIEYDAIHDIALLGADEWQGMQFPYTLSGSDLAPPGTPIVSIGYPHAGHGRMVATQQTSTVGARVLLSSGVIKSKHLVMNVQTRPGQSGSPVFLDGGNHICAMVIGPYSPGRGIMLGDVDPATLHQTTHALSAEYIARML